MKAPNSAVCCVACDIFLSHARVVVDNALVAETQKIGKKKKILENKLVMAALLKAFFVKISCINACYYQ